MVQPCGLVLLRPMGYNCIPPAPYCQCATSWPAGHCLTIVPSGTIRWQMPMTTIQTEPSHPKVPPVEDEEAIKECPYKRLRPLKEGQQEAFFKDSSLVRVARQTYWESHLIDFRQEGSHDLSSVLHEMVSSTCLLHSSIFEVQDTWCGRKDLKAANQVAKNSPKCIHFFRLISPMDHLK